MQTEDYLTIARHLSALKRPTLICQEGGYNLDFLGDCVYTFLNGFMR
ncbi:MAG: hypothetical protein K9N49_03165 [Candidatus Marinimicrobia bacterium]|nr:hypothetical protein [Candidatus Neomarinimicrobiota bacterium]